MGLIDSHAHLTYPELAGQIDAVLARCAEAGVEQVITIGTDLSEIARALELADRFPERIRVGAGFHPHQANDVSEADLDAVRRHWDVPRVVALGEMGLDYHYDFADRGHQRRVFEGQLVGASKVDKPVVIHSREAFDDTLDMLVDHGFTDRRVVFHCFTGTAQEAARLREKGWRLSLTGIVTFPKSDDLRAIARDYPLDELMVETDAPYLSPVPVRGKKPNEPAFVAHTARFLAELRGEAFDDFVERTSANTRDFFNL